MFVLVFIFFFIFPLFPFRFLKIFRENNNLRCCLFHLQKTRKKPSEGNLSSVKCASSATTFEKDFSSIRTTKYGLNSISYLAPKIWDLIPNEIKRCDNLISFKQKIKSWRPENCPCTLCKVYIPNLGYI